MKIYAVTFLKIPISGKIKKIFKFNDTQGEKPQKRLTTRIFKNQILAASDCILVYTIIDD